MIYDNTWNLNPNLWPSMMEGWGEDGDSALPQVLIGLHLILVLGKIENTSTKFGPVSKMSEEIKQTTSF